MVSDGSGYRVYKGSMVRWVVWGRDCVGVSGYGVYEGSMVQWGGVGEEVSRMALGDVVYERV